jgi:predicted secreted hydrolase
MTPVILRGSRLPGPEGSASGSAARATVSLLAVALALAAALVPQAPGSKYRRDGEEVHLGAGPDASGFARVTEPRPFTLPRDHGPHFDYQTEWWYFTGNVVATDGRRFGFQLTFFRRGLTPGPPPDGPGLSSNQVYFAHLAITDVAGRRHVAAERFSRGAGGLAGATGEPFAVWLEDWRAESLSPDGSAVRLVADDTETGLALDLALAAKKPLVAHGFRGLSPKSDEPGNASYYVGYTRLSARGRLGVSGDVSVAGEAWFDHEWSTSALGPGAVGWDWFSLQLDDGRELMLFQIRREDGSAEAVSGGTLVERDGRARRLAREEVSIDVLDHWTSAESGGRYPSRWRVRVLTAALDLAVEPWLDDQEMRTSFVYWEGAVRVSGRTEGRHVSGQGYVELTGYERSMQGVF